MDPVARDYDRATPGAETTASEWTTCDEGSSVQFWRLEGSRHIPPFSPVFQDALVEHLLAQQ